MPPTPASAPATTAAARRAVAVATGAVPAQTFARDGGIAGAAAGSPDLLARVAALPPATGDPDIPDDLARSADPDFGLRHLIRPVRRWLLVGLVLVALEAAAQLVLPAVVRSGIDSGIAEGSLGTLVALSALALGVVLAAWAVSRAALLVTGRTGERLLYLLRVKTFAHLQRLGLDYYEREPAGRIMTRMTTDVDALSNFLQTGLADLLVSTLTVGGVLVALFLLDPGLALVLLALLPFLVAGDAGRSGAPSSRPTAEARDALGGGERAVPGGRRGAAGAAGLRAGGAQPAPLRRRCHAATATCACAPSTRIAALLPVRRAGRQPRRRARPRLRRRPAARRHADRR